MHIQPVATAGAAAPVAFATSRFSTDGSARRTSHDRYMLDMVHNPPGSESGLIDEERGEHVYEAESPCHNPCGCTARPMIAIC